MLTVQLTELSQIEHTHETGIQIQKQNISSVLIAPFQLLPPQRVTNIRNSNSEEWYHLFCSFCKLNHSLCTLCVRPFHSALYRGVAQGSPVMVELMDGTPIGFLVSILYYSYTGC